MSNGRMVDIDQKFNNFTRTLLIIDKNEEKKRQSFFLNNKL